MTIWHICHKINKGEIIISFNIIFYEKQDGERPARDFIFGLDEKMQAKMIGLLEVLGEKGNALREPYSKYLQDGIFEIRCKVGNNIARVLCFFYYQKKIVITNGFVKKTVKTPRKEVELAKRRRREYIERMDKNE